MLREICFDTETTGFDPYKGDRLVEVGCVEVVDGVRTGNNLHIYINPEREVPEDAVKIHGLTTEFLLDKPLFHSEAERIWKYFHEDPDTVLVAHNAQFDMRFMNFEFDKAGYKKIELKVTDSLDIAKKKFPGQKNSLDALCKRYNVDSSRRVLHGALLDAELLADVYIEMTEKAQQNMYTVNGNGGIHKNGEAGSADMFTKPLEAVERKTLPSRNFELSEEDVKAHEDFINSKFKENLWGYTKKEG